MKVELSEILREYRTKLDETTHENICLKLALKKLENELEQYRETPD